MSEFDAMVTLQEDIDSGETWRSLPVFHIDDITEDSSCGQSLITCIRDALATANTKDAGVLLYNLPHTLDARVEVGASGSVYVPSSLPQRFSVTFCACTSSLATLGANSSAWRSRQLKFPSLSMTHRFTS